MNRRSFFTRIIGAGVVAKVVPQVVSQVPLDAVDMTITTSGAGDGYRYAYTYVTPMGESLPTKIVQNVVKQHLYRYDESGKIYKLIGTIDV